MKSTTVLLTVTLLAPSAIAFGLAAPVAFGISAITGLLAIAVNDYGTRRLSYLDTKVAAAAKAERLPLAA
ncbi:hypothetical protein [Synoicihabitans lomoniglobus]|uniref:Holin n=1 Tax=Synoicihabitans lomoniglobus TaxID=2909285 RepID=A0AAF0CMH7_9BACT|nr:hypothetical protein [Opitutaceae bacterium LMO-M01]WED64143.1 hypothetical protein PXH66_17535 [Opitutaceae bacterium LMO-M01]